MECMEEKSSLVLFPKSVSEMDGHMSSKDHTNKMIRKYLFIYCCFSLYRDYRELPKNMYIL